MRAPSPPGSKQPVQYVRQRHADFGAALAAVLDEVGEQLLDRGVIRRVNDRAALPAGPDQACLCQNMQAGRQGVGRRAQPAGQLAGGQTARPGAHEQAEDFQPSVLRQGR